jgi:hypothetical protein
MASWQAAAADGTETAAVWLDPYSAHVVVVGAGATPLNVMAPLSTGSFHPLLNGGSTNALKAATLDVERNRLPQALDTVGAPYTAASTGCGADASVDRSGALGA